MCMYAHCPIIRGYLASRKHRFKRNPCDTHKELYGNMKSLKQVFKHIPMYADDQICLTRQRDTRIKARDTIMI